MEFACVDCFAVFKTRASASCWRPSTLSKCSMLYGIGGNLAALFLLPSFLRAQELGQPRIFEKFFRSQIRMDGALVNVV